MGTNRYKWQVIREFAIARYHRQIDAASYMSGAIADWDVQRQTYIIHEFPMYGSRMRDVD